MATGTQRRMGVNERKTMQSRRATRNERMAVASRTVVHRGRKPLLILLVVLVLAFCAYQAYQRIDLRSMVVLKHVQVEGNHVLAWEDVLSAAKVELGLPMSDLRVDSIQNRLERLDLVHSAEVSRSFPSTLKIRLVEAQPLFLESDAQGWKLYSDKGTRIPMRQDLGMQLPVVTANGSKAFAMALSLLCDLHNADLTLYAQASQVVVNSDASNAEVFFRNVDFKVLFGANRDAQVFHRYRLLVQSLTKDLHTASVIDMRFPGFAVARPVARERQDG